MFQSSAGAGKIYRDKSKTSFFVLRSNVCIVRIDEFSSTAAAGFQPDMTPLVVGTGVYKGAVRGFRMSRPAQAYSRSLGFATQTPTPCESKLQTQTRIRMIHINHLPDLVLVEIFMLLYLTTPTAPWALCAVCYKWRSILLSRSVLWSNVHLAMPYASSVSTATPDFQLEKLQVQLKRSGRRLLDVSLSLQAPPSPSSTREYWAPVLEVVCREAERWGTLTLSADADNIRLLYSAMSGALPLYNLRRLNLLLLAHNPVSPTSLPSMTKVFENATKLKELVITTDPCGWTSKLGIPFGQITRLNVSVLDFGTGAGGIVGVLEEMGALEVLVVQRFRRRNSWAEEERIELPKLHSLLIGSVSGGDVFLDRLDLPSLRVLRLGGSVGVGVGMGVEGILTRVKGTVRELALDALMLRANMVRMLEVDKLALYHPTAETIRSLPRVCELALFNSKEVDNVTLGSLGLKVRKLWLHDTEERVIGKELKESGVEVHQSCRWWTEFLQ
ncbi:hypothetical protein Moror_1577 [Moniliophthora roreri MCA 2997]|uniref:F-box domain-containing protein n=2 Tax=Moniliophthora roreri TaxID=221103 RepID=V2XL39_MONRO|nr:hypothetical protein Moror_1577 [Moniliophthora roreri MCA 2997]